MVGGSETTDLTVAFLVLGCIFLAGLAADQIGRRTKLPRVTLLLACGIAVGGAGFDLLPEGISSWYNFLSTAALTMVAFLLGGSLSAKNMRRHGRAILWISGSVVIATVLLVGLGLWAMGLAPGLALLLGAIATATDPAATQDSIRQCKARGGFVKTLNGIVAIDDAWGMLVFSFCVVAARSFEGGGVSGGGVLLDAVSEIGLSIALGLVIGFVASFLTGRLSKGEPLQTEALGVVFLTAGLALWLEVSFLLAGMVAGAVIVNRARHHKRAFHEIEHIQWPFMLLFFVLAGASLDTAQIANIGMIGAAYAVLRVLARIVGGWIGARASEEPVAYRVLYGPAMLPQAGVAVGMALVAAQEFPEYADVILTLSIGTTVLFELIGPFATVRAIRRAEAS